MSKLMVTRAFNPSHREVNELRGSTALELLMQYTILGSAMEIINPLPDGMIKFSPQGVTYFDLALAYESTGFADQLLSKYRLIVDVHFPVCRPSYILSFNENGISEDATHSVVAFWSRPEIQYWVHSFLAAVPAITTPHKDTFDDLRRINRNVFLVPDVVSAKTALRFCKQFCKAVSVTTTRPASWLERIAGRTRFEIGWAPLIHPLREHLKLVTWGDGQTV